VDVDEVEVIGPEPAQTPLHRLDHLRDGSLARQVAVGRAELRGDAQALPGEAPDPLAEGLLGAGARVVRRGVEVVDPALDGQARHRGVGEAGAAEGDVRHLEAGAAERAGALHPRAGPAGARELRLGDLADQEELAPVLAASEGGEAGGPGGPEQRAAGEAPLRYVGHGGLRLRR
jgi:hypothetical protein